MSQNLTTTTDAMYGSDVEQRKGVVLVDFWAEWCAPCKALLPIVSEVADLYAGSAVFMKVNADDNNVTLDRLNIRGLPTLILYKDGLEQERVIGMTSKTRLVDLIDKYLEA